MKKLLIIFILLGNVLIITRCQITNTVGKLIYEDTLTFWPLHNWITLDTSHSNIWQIGKPNKEYFSSACYGDKAIMTDSAFFYSNNCNDTFYVTIPNDYQWGEGILSFYHKFDTDSLIDGGVIEISYDNYTSWINITDDIYHIHSNFIGLYEDTIRGGEYGFSGRSNNWQYVELYWWWIALVKSTSMNIYSPRIRFRFISDDINTNKEGWMIDGMVFRGYEINDAIDKNIINNAISFPIPSSEIVKFNLQELYSVAVNIELFNSVGEMLARKELINSQIDISKYRPGIYFYKIYNNNELILKGKLIKN